MQPNLQRRGRQLKYSALKVQRFGCAGLKSYSSIKFSALALGHPCGDPGNLAPFGLLYYPYSTPHNQLPKSDGPNTYSVTWEILAVTSSMSTPSIALQYHLHFVCRGIQYAYGHDPCSQLPLRSECPQRCIFVSTMLDSDAEHLLVIRDIDIWSPKRYEPSIGLLYGYHGASST